MRPHKEILENELPESVIELLSKYVIEECLFDDISTVAEKLRKFNSNHNTGFAVSHGGASIIRSDGSTVIELASPMLD